MGTSASEHLMLKKLAQAQQKFDDLIIEFDGQTDLYEELTSKLAQACKGLHRELDNKLAKHRTVLSKKPNLEVLTVVANDIFKTLKSVDQKLSQKTQEMQNDILDFSERLQKSKGLPNQVRRDLRDLIEEVQMPQDNLLGYISFFEKLLALYQTTVTSKEDIQPNQRVAIAQTSANCDNSNIEKISQRLVLMISELLDENTFPPKIKEKFQLIRAKLEQAQTNEELIRGFTKSMELVIASLKTERQTAEQFLYTLNSSILNLRDSIKSSAKVSNEAHHVQNTFNKSLTQQLKAMSKTVSSADSIEQFQVNITEQLEAITSAFNAKVNGENDKNKALTKELSKLQNELAQIEQESKALKKQLSEHKKNSLLDSLTKLPNRYALDEQCEKEYKQWQSQKTPLSIAVVDLDHFKRINDNYGHSAGDKTLEIIAKAMQKIIKAPNFIARYGGEEFIILLPKLAIKDAQRLLDLMRKKISSLPLKFKQDKVSISISAGITALEGDDTIESAFNRADEALYQAKDQGRNKVVVN